MGRVAVWILGAGVVLVGLASPARAQVYVDVGIWTPHVRARVATAPPVVYAPRVVYAPPVYVPSRRVVPVPVYVASDRYTGRRTRGWGRPGRGYARDVYAARREYARDRARAERDYAEDLREARRDYERDVRSGRRGRW